MALKIENKLPSIIDLCERHKYPEAVIAYVLNWSHRYPDQGVTFDMLERLLSAFIKVSGNESIDLPNTQNILVWVGCSKDFKQIVLEAIMSLRIHGDACKREAYQYDQRMLPYMIAQPSDFKKRPAKTKWQPLWLLPGSGVATLDEQRAN